MPRERGMQYPASIRQAGQMRCAAFALASAAHLPEVMGRTGLAQSMR